MQDQWLIRFKEVVQREIDEAGGKPAAGYRAVAMKTGLGYDYIYQIFMGKPVNKPKLPGHEAMTAIERVYGATPSTQPQPPQPKALEEPAGAPTLAQALGVMLDAMAESPHRAELRQLLPMLVDTNAPAYRQRLGELLAPGGPANPTKPAIQAQTHDFAGKPPQIHNKETAGKAPATHRAGNFIKP